MQTPQMAVCSSCPHMDGGQAHTVRQFPCCCLASGMLTHTDKCIDRQVTPTLLTKYTSHRAEVHLSLIVALISNCNTDTTDNIVFYESKY